MAFTSKLNLINGKTYQESGGSLDLSGTTRFGTVEYLADMSGSYTDRSLVDAGYVNGLTGDLQSQIDYVSGQTDLRLLISDFESYTGDTEVILNNLRTDINTVSGQTDINTSNISNLGALSGITEVSITGATNGLSKDGIHNVKLGGALIENTIISGLDSYNLNLSGNSINYSEDYSSTFTARSLPDVGYVTGITDTLVKTNEFNAYTGDTDTRLDNIETDIDTVSGQTDINTSDISDLSGVTEISVTGATNGLSKDGDHDVKLGGTLLEDTVIDGLNLVNLTFTGGDIKYSTDYSGQFVDRSLVDKGYVDTCVSTSTGAIQASNGLTRDGDNITLGGSLTGNTNISGLDTNTLELSGGSIQYSADYSGQYTSHSLVDANYVTGITDTLVKTNEFNAYTGDTDIRLDDIETDINTVSGQTNTNTSDISNLGTLSGITEVSITGATNGLSKDGDHDVKLGGSLTENTDISGLGTYDLTLTGGDIQYSADYSGQFVNRSLVDKAYVDTATGGIQANNGLTRNGDYISLGGSLTGDTEISGIDTLTVSSPYISNNVQYFNFDTAPDLPTSFSEGLLYFSGNSLNLRRDFTEVITQLGEETVVRVTNQSGVLIENGNVVSFVAAVAGTPGVTLAVADDFALATQAVGIATHDIPDGQEGYVTLEGQVKQLDTGSFTEGDVIWLSDTTAGEFTNTRPSYPNYSVSVGAVLISDSTEGVVSVRMMYVPNYTEYGEFTGYTATTQTELNNKLYTSTFNSYTGDTELRLIDIEDVTDIALTGVTNGLTKVGDHDARFGGTLTQNTTISGSHSLTLSPSNTLNLRTTGNNSVVVDAQENGKAIFKAQQGTITSGDDFTCGIGIYADYDATSGFVIYDNRNNTKQQGIRYDADYSSNFINRSLVDKAYVDSIATGLQAKSATIVATTQNIDLSGLTTVDGISLNTGDRVLVKNQTDGGENGIYSASTDTWNRVDDYDFTPEGEIANGDLIPVLSGNTNASSQFILTTEDPIASGDTLSFSLFSQLLDVSAGNGIAINTVGSTENISVALTSDSGLNFSSGDLTINSEIAGSGLTWNAGVINVCATDTAISGSEINVKFGETNNNLVVDSNDFQTLTADNGITIDGSDTILFGGDLSQNTIITGNAGAYNLSFNNLNSFNLSFDNTSIITDNRATERGLEYAADYSSSFNCNSLVSGQFVNDQITGDTLTFNNGLTKDGDTISWGGTLTGDTQVIHGAGRICMLNGATSCVDLVSDCSTVHLENTSLYLRSCTNGSCTGAINMTNTGEISLSTNNATSGITITDSGSGKGAIYDADYSGTFIDRSLVDKGYVDTCVSDETATIQSEAITGATNGLTKDGQDAKLGGILNENTLISGNSYSIGFHNLCNFYIGDFTYPANSLVTNLTGSSSITVGQLGTGNVTGIANTDTDINIYASNSSNDDVGICIAQTSFIIYDEINNTGLKYALDYSTNFTARSIPDVGYVTGITSSIESDVSQAITGATNGLTKDGQDVKLGGIFTENTSITTNTYDLAIKAENINLSGNTAINLTGVVTLQTTPITGSITDGVLVWNSSDNQVKQVDGSNLGDDNNRYDTTGITNSTITLTGSEYVVLIDTNSGGVTVTLPATPDNGTAFKIKDKGNALSNNITIDGNGNTIDGSSNALINTDYGALELVFDGTEWFSLAFIN